MPHKYKCKKCGEEIERHVKYPMFYCPKCNELAPEYIEYVCGLNDPHNYRGSK